MNSFKLKLKTKTKALHLKVTLKMRALCLLRFSIMISQSLLSTRFRKRSFSNKLYRHNPNFKKLIRRSLFFTKFKSLKTRTSICKLSWKFSKRMMSSKNVKSRGFRRKLHIQLTKTRLLISKSRPFISCKINFKRSKTKLKKRNNRPNFFKFRKFSFL